MDDREIRHLVDRVDKIERRCRKWRILATGAAVAVALLVGLQSVGRNQTQKSIRAMEFVLVDAVGRALVRIGEVTESNGSGALVVYDAEGEGRIGIGINKTNTPYVVLSTSNANGADQILLDVQPEHGSAIAFKNSKNQSGLLLGADATGVAALGFMDSGGQRLVEMAINPDDRSARLILRSADGKKLFEAP